MKKLLRVVGYVIASPVLLFLGLTGAIATTVRYAFSDDGETWLQEWKTYWSED